MVEPRQDSTEHAVDLWRAAFARFEELQALDPAQAEEALAALCRDQPELHEKVLRLMQADRQAGQSRFLDGTAAAGARPVLGAGAQFGAYRLERLLGRGGMGEVWLAGRADGLYQGRAAIKTLHPHLSHSRMRERFAREGRILGALQHRNIARLLDAGAGADGTLYLVLEYVEGTRLDHWCDEHRLDVPARLRLFLKVCEAVAHAHGHLIVHRDLKPSNILVDAQGEIKLLDFGIAKLLEAEQAAPEAELTRFEERLLTPEYAAPEQLLGRPVTTATDVFTLGVLLYLLLCGHRPYGSGLTTALEIEHAVLRAEPESPSAAAARGTPAAGAAELAARRGLTPARLRGVLRGDLDNIVARALRKEPAQRYPSVLALADDVQRHLRHQPIEAHGESFAYRAGKFVRRNRAGVAAAAAAAATLAVGLAGIVWQAQLAQAESRRAERVKEFLINVFEQADPDHAQGQALSARAALEQGMKQMPAQLDSEPLVQADLDDAVARIEDGLGNFDRALTLAQQALELRRRALGPSDVRVGQSLYTLGSIRLDRDEYVPARDALLQAQAIFNRRSRENGLELAQVGSALAGAAAGMGERRHAVELQQGAFAQITALADPPPREVADQTLKLGRRLEEGGDYAAAEQRYRQAARLLATSWGAGHSKVAEARMDLAGLLDRLGRSDEAEVEMTQAIAILKKVYGERHPQVADALFSRSILRIHQHRYAEGVADLREALLIYPPGGHDAATCHDYLGVALTYLERYDEAQAELTQAIAGFNAGGSGNDLIQLNRARSDLALVKLRQGLPAQAEPILREAIANLERLVGPQGYEVRTPLKNLADALIAQGRNDEGLTVLERVRALEIKLLGSSETRDSASTDYLAAKAQLAIGTPQALAQARLLADHAVALRRRYAPGEDLARALLLRGRVALALGDKAAAGADFGEALAGFKRSRGSDDTQTRQAGALLASLDGHVQPASE
ncbi:MAG: protein kinase [Nevskia sp.]|nr:protein kinase [Nevskia sp.]